jgi:HAD superfamily phosphatase (TIGR01668 family)
MIKAVIFDLGNTLVSQETGNAFPYAVDTLNQLKKTYRLGLICNVTPPTNSERVQNILSEAGIPDVFEVVVVSSEVGFSKPYPQIFEIVLNRLNVEPEEAVMIGNTISTDIFGGNRVGMNTILIQDDEEYKRSEWETPDHIIQSLRELLDIV